MRSDTDWTEGAHCICLNTEGLNLLINGYLFDFKSINNASCAVEGQNYPLRPCC